MHLLHEASRILATVDTPEAKALVKEIEVSWATEAEWQQAQEVAKSFDDGTECEVDPGATTSRTDEGGTWISGWVWIRDQDADEA